jgi:hypothetical protein
MDPELLRPRRQVDGVVHALVLLASLLQVEIFGHERVLHLAPVLRGIERRVARAAEQLLELA